MEYKGKGHGLILNFAKPTLEMKSLIFGKSGFIKALRWIPPSRLEGRKTEIRRRRISLLFLLAI